MYFLRPKGLNYMQGWRKQSLDGPAEEMHFVKNVNFNYIHDDDIIFNAVVQSSMFRIELSITPMIIKTAEIVCGDI